MTTVTKADAALGLLEDLLAVELLLARDVLAAAPARAPPSARSSRRSPPPTPIRTPFTVPCASASRPVPRGCPRLLCRADVRRRGERRRWRSPGPAAGRRRARG